MRLGLYEGTFGKIHAIGDPDHIRIFEPGLNNMPDDPTYYLITLLFSGYLHREYLRTIFVDFWTTRSAFLNKAIFWVAVLAGAYYSEEFAQIMGLYYVIPFFLVLPVIRYWAEASEHLGMNLTGRFGNSRSNLGFSHSHHAVHHLHSQVPFHQLPEAHDALISQNEAFQSKIPTGFRRFNSWLGKGLWLSVLLGNPNLDGISS
ncbi:hypothetical protein F4810DRAFT_505775 [Camillea tinctor]|nr:hypothetical protein F4810DRAFT_505775 [Camillea tinctor]